MTFCRAFLLAFGSLLATAMTSAAALAGCGGCGWGPAPVAYASPPAYAPEAAYAPEPTYAPAPAYQPAPAYGPVGCGGCSVAPAMSYAPPQVEPMPVAPAPIAVDHWDTGGWGGCGGCGGCGSCGASVAYVPQVAPSPVYVVNQGPEYSGPGFMVPYRTYSPYRDVAAPANYPYVRPWRPRYAHPYIAPSWRPRYVHPYYRARYVAHPHVNGPDPYWHRHYW